MSVQDSGWGEVLADVLAAAHRLAPRDIPELVQRAAGRLGFAQASVYVADVQQRVV
ncbi:hypothetical protein [Kitasatospora sp. MBT63]|uniref:hypothetical protein n=1 Tax=Kitasatospora sp. MBT63 TaxID=1444768 RepID=UPI000ACC005C|nr:hypothetical protein [Kitasatospora sp. MBT63]